MRFVHGIMIVLALLVPSCARATSEPVATAAKVMACYVGGSDTVLGMYACSGSWVTPRILTLCFLEADCLVIPDSVDARQVVAAALGGEERSDARLAVDLREVLGAPDRAIIDGCQAITDETAFSACVSRKMTRAALSPVLSCAASASDKDRAVCLAGTMPKELDGVATAIRCVADQGGGEAALRGCANLQPWDDVERVRSCWDKASSSGAKSDCLLASLDPKSQELGRCLGGTDDRSADALACLGKLDPVAATEMKEVSCAANAGTDEGRLVACFTATARGDGAKIAACALGDPGKVVACLLETRPEYRPIARLVACAQGGRDAASIVASCSDLLVTDAKTRATLACAARAGVEPLLLVGCAASTVLPPAIARFASCAAANQGPTAFALCAANPVMNEEWRIAAECAVHTGGDPIGFAGCTAGRLTLKELAQCLDGRSCFGPNNTIVRAYANIFKDLMHGPGQNNEVVVAFREVAELSGGPHSMVNDPGQVFGGRGSLFHDPAGLLGSNSSLANQILTKLSGGPHSVPNEAVRAIEHAPRQAEIAVSKGGQAVAKGAAHVGREIGKRLGIRRR